MNKIRVLIVDDSSIIRMFLQNILASDPEIQVIGAVPDPFYAREKIAELKPDVIVLDIEMPRMDGLSFLKKVMEHLPIPTIIFSSLTKQSSPMVLEAFEAGAVEVIEKPEISIEKGLNSISETICGKVKIAARSNMNVIKFSSAKKNQVQKTNKSALTNTTHKIIAFAASTGGTTALKTCMQALPSDIPGIVITQHLPPKFTQSFADSLNKICNFEVREAEDGDKIIPGKAYVAPGNYHLEVERQGGYYFTRLHQKELLHGVRPAADYMFKSIAKCAGNNSIGIVLTGMGRDGAAGLLDMKNAGAFTICQDEETSLVYGMPKACMDIHAAHIQVSLDQVAETILAKL